MQVHRRRFLRLLAGVPGLPAVLRSAKAEAYPSRRSASWSALLPAAGRIYWRG